MACRDRPDRRAQRTARRNPVEWVRIYSGMSMRVTHGQVEIIQSVFGGTETEQEDRANAQRIADHVEQQLRGEDG